MQSSLHSVVKGKVETPRDNVRTRTGKMSPHIDVRSEKKLPQRSVTLDASTTGTLRTQRLYRWSRTSQTLRRCSGDKESIHARISVNAIDGRSRVSRRDEGEPHLGVGISIARCVEVVCLHTVLLLAVPLEPFHSVWTALCCLPLPCVWGRKLLDWMEQDTKFLRWRTWGSQRCVRVVDVVGQDLDFHQVGMVVPVVVLVVSALRRTNLTALT